MLSDVLVDALAQRGDRVALLHEGSSITFTQLSEAVDRLAGQLATGPGERVAVLAPNFPAIVVGMLAAWRTGSVAVPLSARLRRFELERTFADAQPAAAVSVRTHGGFDLAHEVQAVAGRTESVRRCLVVDEAGAVQQRLDSYAQGASPSPDEVAAILYTSGTTGEPKGALVRHALAETMAHNLAEVLGEDAAAPYGLAVPVSHAFGLGCLLAGLLAGGAAVLADVTTSILRLLEALRASSSKILHGSPALLERVLRAEASLKLRSGFVAGSRCPPELLSALDQRGVQILNMYGMTELGAISSCRREDPEEIRYHTVGRALPGYELRIADGEIQVRSGLLPSGYRGRQWGPDELTGDGWFRTGDLGELDSEGNLRIAGRAKEVVHVGGFNVFPAEVEAFLLTHPAIAQVAVLGIPHSSLGEAVCAFVVRSADAELEASEVIRYARSGIAGYKVPYSVRFVEELPLLPSGKPDRRELARAAELQKVGNA